MDTAKEFTHVSLCAGYGGIDLGLKRVVPNLRTIAFSEIEAYACANLVAKMEAGHLDAAPIWTDLKTFPWGAFYGCVDILSGGYPCQPFSSAGKRLGKDDPRHLWPYIADGIRAMRPRQCFFENVDGHISLGLREVVSELESIGYKTTWGVFSASEVGAPHQRKRVFILADNQRERVQELGGRITGTAEYPPPLGTAVLLAQPGCQRSTTGISRQEPWHEGHTGISNDGCREMWPSRPNEPQHGWEPPRVVPRIMDDAGSQEQHGLPESGEWDAGAAIGEPSNSMAHTLRPIETRREPTGGEASSPGPHDQLGGPATRSGQTQPRLGGVSYGRPFRVDRLRLLGNGVVPATAAKAYLTLLSQLQPIT